MKKNLNKLFLVSFLTCSILALTSCDKVEKIYPVATYDTALNTSLYPGTWQNYLDNEWPDFDATTASTERNIVIEDFTGHNCQYCPAAATVAHNLHMQHPQRVFISSIHSSPTGITGFQAVNSQYPVDFTNPQALELGQYFGGVPTSGFFGNPSVGCNRIPFPGSTEIYYPAGSLGNQVSAALNSTLKVALQSKVNYYNDTKGAFIHTEVELLDNSLANNLAMQIVIQQDSLIAPQNVNGTYTPDYVHRDIHRGHLTNSLWGVTLTEDMKKENGKYYLDFSLVVPNALTLSGATTYDASNMHLLIYVYDKTTLEIYQVNREKFQ